MEEKKLSVFIYKNDTQFFISHRFSDSDRKNENKKKQLFEQKYKENEAIEQFFFPDCQVEINKCKLHS